MRQKAFEAVIIVFSRDLNFLCQFFTLNTISLDPSRKPKKQPQMPFISPHLSSQDINLYCFTYTVAQCSVFCNEVKVAHS